MVVTDVNNVAELQSPGGEHIEFRDDFLLAKAIPDLYNPRVTLDVAMWEIEPGFSSSRNRPRSAGREKRLSILNC